MAECRFRDSTVIGDYKLPYVVAEVNTSHNGSMKTAKALIDGAKTAGCHCVKFQSWSAESLYSKSYYKENPISKRIFNKFAFSEENLLEVAEYSKNAGIAFNSTPYSKEEVDFLIEKCRVPYIKIASMDINNYPFLDYIAKTNVPIVLATGMAEMDEIYKAVEIIEKAGNKNLCLLHCISIYPPEISTIQLNNIIGLRHSFPGYPIGFSDHSLGIEMDSAAVVLGAALIEKHLTLDRTKIGMDNHMAIHPEEMAQLVRNCHSIHMALGGTEREVTQEETLQRNKMRRSIVAARDLKAGTRLSIDDLNAKRPGTGIPPEKTYELIGKTVKKDIEADTPITIEDIE